MTEDEADRYSCQLADFFGVEQDWAAQCIRAFLSGDHGAMRRFGVFADNEDDMVSNLWQVGVF